MDPGCWSGGDTGSEVHSHICGERLGIPYLQGVFSREEIKTLRWQAETADSVVLEIISIVLIADRKGIRGSELVVDAGANIVASLWSWDGVGEGNDGKTCRGGINDLRVYDREIVDVSNICSEKEGCFLAPRATDVAAVL